MPLEKNVRDLLVIVVGNGPVDVDFAQRFDFVAFFDGVLLRHVVMEFEMGVKRTKEI